MTTTPANTATATQLGLNPNDYRRKGKYAVVTVEAGNVEVSYVTKINVDRLNSIAYQSNGTVELIIVDQLGNQIQHIDGYVID